jgi:hypothetical protein
MEERGWANALGVGAVPPKKYEQGATADWKRTSSVEYPPAATVIAAA